jgi:hypothetical protein
MFNRKSSARHKIRLLLATAAFAGTIGLGRANAGGAHFVRAGSYIINLDQLDYFDSSRGMAVMNARGETHVEGLEPHLTEDLGFVHIGSRLINRNLVTYILTNPNPGGKAHVYFRGLTVGLDLSPSDAAKIVPEAQ